MMSIQEKSSHSIIMRFVFQGCGSVAQEVQHIHHYRQMIIVEADGGGGKMNVAVVGSLALKRFCFFCIYRRS